MDVSLDASSLAKIIEQIKKDIQKTSMELRQKEALLKTASDDKRVTEAGIKAKEEAIKKEEADEKKLNAEILQDKSKAFGLVGTSKKLNAEVLDLMHTHSTLNQQLVSKQIEYQNQLKKAGSSKGDFRSSHIQF